MFSSLSVGIGGKGGKGPSYFLADAGLLCDVASKRGCGFALSSRKTPSVMSPGSSSLLVPGATGDESDIIDSIGALCRLRPGEEKGKILLASSPVRTPEPSEKWLSAWLAALLFLSLSLAIVLRWLLKGSRG